MGDSLENTFSATDDLSDFTIAGPTTLDSSAKYKTINKERSEMKLGIENIDDYLYLFEGKRVGLITNPTGVDQDFRSTIDILNEKVNLCSLFAPEHGIRGEVQAGVQLDTYTDKKTGLTVYSLYGKSKRPTKEMLDNIDIICFDIQDVGCRFYTYIWTLAYVMEAAAEFNKKVVVFDRPNPLGGLRVEGNILKPEYKSFVGYLEIPQRHGLTVGELAIMFKEHFKINCELDIVKMSGWKREMYFEDTGLDYILPSPNLPTPESVLAYLTTCIFEGTNISEGRGTTKPFQFFGHPNLDPELFVSSFEEYKLEGCKLRPIYFTPKFSKHKGELCGGVELFVTNKDIFSPVKTSFVLFYEMQKVLDNFEILQPFKKGKNLFLELLVGDDFLTKNPMSLDAIMEKIDKDSHEFEILKVKYQLY
jgi:uncharacterized protein YbbC (DUF1343 family)